MPCKISQETVEKIKKEIKGFNDWGDDDAIRKEAERRLAINFANSVKAVSERARKGHLVRDLISTYVKDSANNTVSGVTKHLFFFANELVDFDGIPLKPNEVASILKEIHSGMFGRTSDQEAKSTTLAFEQYCTVDVAFAFKDMEQYIIQKITK